MSVVSPAVVVLVVANNPWAAVAIVLCVVALVVALVVSFIANAISERITRKRELAYRLANQCKGITKKGEQCLRWNDCPHHSN